MKWINSRRFIIALASLGVILYIVVSGCAQNNDVAKSLVPVLVAFMGATTADKFVDKQMRKKNEEGE
jgi:hypothetical protein